MWEAECQSTYMLWRISWLVISKLNSLLTTLVWRQMLHWDNIFSTHIEGGFLESFGTGENLVSHDGHVYHWLFDSLFLLCGGVCSAAISWSENPKRDLTMNDNNIQSPWSTEVRTHRREGNVLRSLLWVWVVFSVFGTEEKQKTSLKKHHSILAKKTNKKK